MEFRSFKLMYSAFVTSVLYFCFSLEFSFMCFDLFLANLTACSMIGYWHDSFHSSAHARGSGTWCRTLSSLPSIRSFTWLGLEADLVILVLAGQTNFVTRLDLSLPTFGCRLCGAMVEQHDGPSWLRDDDDEDVDRDECIVSKPTWTAQLLQRDFQGPCALRDAQPMMSESQFHKIVNN